MARLWLARWVARGCSLAALLASCSSTPKTGFVEVLLSDHREAIGDFSRLTVELVQIELHPADSPADRGWVALPPDVAAADLTQLTGGTSLTVARGEIPAQSYDAVRLILAGGNGLLTNDTEILFAEFSEAGRVEFDLTDGGRATILIDLVVQDQSDHPGEGYVLLLGRTELVAGD